jgi:hypothetical protein
MVQAILPQSSSTDWERAVARAGDVEPLVQNAIAALKTFKYSPPSSLLDYLIYERGLADLTTFVSNKYQLWNEGEEFLEKRGTDAALQIGLSWLSVAGVLEEENTERRFWNLFQLALDRVVVDQSLLEKIDGVAHLSAPLRSKFWRGYHGFDIRPLTFGESHWGNAHWGAYSGTRLRPDGALWSFGRTYEHALVPTEAELIELGVLPEPLFVDFTELHAAGESGFGAFSEVTNFSRASSKWAQDSAGVYQEFAANQPAITDKGLLIEPAATNLVTYSESFDNADWLKIRNSIGASISSPLPGIDALGFVANTNNSDHRTQQSFTTIASEVYTFSAIVKAGDKTHVFLITENTSPVSADTTYFDISNGVVGVTGSNHSNTTIVQISDGYFRVSVTFTGIASGHDFHIAFAAADGVPTFVGDNVTIDGYVCHSQLEVGDTPTSPIITEAAAETRAADSMDIELPAGPHDVVFTFDDGSTQTFENQSGTFVVPTDLNRQVVRSIGLNTDPNDLGWGHFSWAEANASWVDDGEEVRGRLMSAALYDRISHVAFKDGSGDVIGFRRLKYKHFVSPNLNGEYEFAGANYAHSADPTRRIMVEAFTGFGDAVGQVASGMALVLDGELSAGVPAGKAFIPLGDMQSHLTPFGDQATQIEFAPTVRERVRFLLTL